MNNHREPKRGRAVMRLFIVATLLQEAGKALTLGKIREEVNRLMFEDWCERTIRRDMEMLAGMGCVDIVAMEPMQIAWLGFERVLNGGLVIE